MGTSLSQRPWLVRFAWFGVVVLLLLTLVVGYGLWRHESGMADLYRVQERNAKEGRGSTFQDLLADIPDSDPERHERWWRWQNTFASNDRQVQGFYQAWESDDARKWKLGLSANPPKPLTDAFDQVKGLVSELESQLDADPFIAGMAMNFKATFRPDDAAWLLRVFNEFYRNGYEQKPDATLHLLDTYSVDFATSALIYRVLSADSPASCSQALRRMDRLVDDLSHPVGLSETMGLSVASTQRDNAYLSATLRRTLPEKEFATWLADDRYAQSLPRIAKAFRAERIMRTGCLTPLAQVGGLHQVELYDIRVFTRLDGWMAGPAGLALCSDAMADAERRIERGPGYIFELDRWAKSARENSVAHFIMPNLIESGITAAERHFAARRTRVIALIVRHARKSAVPSDMSGVRSVLGQQAPLLDAADDQCAMSYERLADDRFRISLDLTRSAHGEFTPFDRYRNLSTPPTYLSRHGTPTPTPPLPRTDLPPKLSRTMADVEVWIPPEHLPASE